MVSQDKNNGRFVKGCQWRGERICKECSKGFIAKSTQTKLCVDCVQQNAGCIECGRLKGKYHKFCNNTCASKYNHRNKVGGFVNRGKNISLATKNKPKPYFRGENNPNWNGGTYKSLRHQQMNTLEYKNWRKKVFEIHGRECWFCGGNERLEAHHLKSWSEYPELRYDVDNGSVACSKCHHLWHKYKTLTNLLRYFDSIA